MTDVVDPATRSRMMSGIRGKNTRPELFIRRGLHRAGFRFRLHDRRLPGAPDLVLARYNAAIFVHGCFWHRHAGCRYASTPSTRPGFWKGKFDENCRRDERNHQLLLEAGWRVLTVWECGIRHEPEKLLEGLVELLTSGETIAELPDHPPLPDRPED